jgi:hypothetical protein
MNLQSLDIRGCFMVFDLAPLGALVNLQSLDIHEFLKRGRLIWRPSEPYRTCRASI